MDTLLVLQLDAQACEAEAWLNGVALARADPSRPRATTTINEYAMAGANRLELTIQPEPAARAAAPASARLRILVADDQAPPLAQIDITTATGPRRVADIRLPLRLPRWRWLDAPPATATPAVRQQAMALLASLARALSAGDSNGFLSAVHLRTQELAAAYQLSFDTATEQLRDHLAGLHAGGALAWVPPQPDTFAMRPLAGGRLLECLDSDGLPALRTAADTQGCVHFFPLRLNAAKDKLHVLR